ncbi:hypothetical protein [Corynebacterium aurimucosum]|uniref:Putative membrane protein n=1 Tax=Corynebacterium aurimucosum (strain ATCC 700975 / DSM 44827 / CIP 107346 / CN-1) TaxID=548476 RepID=C3PFM1_CORA7|nr:hypothetical protein [Corynebacterium aurimucosum]ACP32625.1 putative membrane protein [Corynebacterium aurimucosum ATCC 700975]QQU93201.1 DUF2269 domain-containing protein [Corynebacterium aurimucosum]
MTSLLIFLHAFAAILLVGTVCISTSVFPAQLAKAGAGDASAAGAAGILNKITSTYGYISAIVPVIGLAVFLTDLATYKSEVQFHIALLLSVIAWVILLVVVIPKQNQAMAAIANPGSADVTKLKKQLSMFSGIFNLLWVICAILMYV